MKINVQRFFGFLVTAVGVHVQSNADIGMTHQILQALKVHTIKIPGFKSTIRCQKQKRH